LRRDYSEMGELHWEEGGVNMINNFGWVITTICLIGDIFNVKKMWICWYIWALGNILWFFIDLHQGLYSRCLLDTVQFCFCVYGIYCWQIMPKKSELCNAK